MPSPVEEPIVEPPPAQFAPPVAPEQPMTDLEWLDSQPPNPVPAAAPEPPPISQWQGAPPQAFGTPKPTASNATASLVLGIVGLVLCPLLASIPAITLGNSAKRQIRENPNLGGSGPATWGVALGWIGLAWGLFVLLVVVLGAGTN